METNFERFNSPEEHQTRENDPKSKLITRYVYVDNVTGGLQKMSNFIDILIEQKLGKIRRCLNV